MTVRVVATQVANCSTAVMPRQQMFCRRKYSECDRWPVFGCQLSAVVWLGRRWRAGNHQPGNSGCAQTVYQRRLSVPPLRGRLMSTSENWGVNGHTTRCTSPVSVVLRLRLVSGWGLMIRRSVPPNGPLRLGKGLYFLLFYTYIFFVFGYVC